MIEEFEFGIEVNGQLIAAFKNLLDRNDCLRMLAEEYDDCKFEAVEL